MGGVSLGTPVTSGRGRTGSQWWGWRRSGWEVGESQDGMGPQKPVKKRSEEEMAVLMLLVDQVRGVLGMDPWV